MKENQEFTEIKEFAAQLTALALQDLCPQTQIFFIQTDFFGFRLACVLKNPLTEELLHHIQDYVSKLCKDKPKVVFREMVPVSLQGLFQEKKQYFLANRAKKSDQTVIDVIQINDFYNFSSKPYEIPSHFALKLKLEHSNQSTPFQGKEKTLTQIRGYVHKGKKELKAFIKKCKQAKDKTHQVIGFKNKLFTLLENEWCYLPKGQELYTGLIRKTRNYLLDQGLQEVKTPCKDHPFQELKQLSQKEEGCKKIFEIIEQKNCCEPSVEKSLYFSRNLTADYCLKRRGEKGIEEDVSFCLQLIEEFLKLFPLKVRRFVNKKNEQLQRILQKFQLNYEPAHQETELKYFLEDIYGRKFEASHLHYDQDSVKFSVLGKAENVLGCLIERVGGDLDHLKKDLFN